MRSSEELESKSNAIINLETTNKKQFEEMDNLKTFHNEKINKLKNEIEYLNNNNKKK